MSDLYLCFLSESFDDASGFTPPFYDIAAPNPHPPIVMSMGGIVDEQGYLKTSVTNETWDYAWWFQTWTYECKRCGLIEDLIVDSETEFLVYEKQEDDYWIETTVSTCSGEQDMDDN